MSSFDEVWDAWSTPLTTRQRTYSTWIALTHAKPPVIIQRSDVGNQAYDVLLETGYACTIPPVWNEVCESLPKICDSFGRQYYDQFCYMTCFEGSAADLEYNLLLWAAKLQLRDLFSGDGITVSFDSRCYPLFPLFYALIDEWESWYSTSQALLPGSLQYRIWETIAFVTNRYHVWKGDW